MNRTLLSTLSALAVAAAALPLAVSAQPGANQIASSATLPELPLASIQNLALPGSLADDRSVNLGGIGSDMWRDPGAPGGDFWLVTDRGPNGQIRMDGKNRRTFPVPDFTPLILQVRTSGDAIGVRQVIPLVGRSGAPVSGLSNVQGHDELPYDYSAQVELSFNPSGLDTEGLVRTSNGEFWLAEEYGPSILRVAADGTVLKRYVPEGIDISAADYDVAATLPGILGLRKGNRGFEGLALSADESTLYIALQSPLSNPDEDVGEASRNTRILAFDVATETVTAEYLYQFQVSTEFGESAIPDDMKVSGLIAVSPTHLLVLERTDAAAHIYRVDLDGASNILGTAADDQNASPSLEEMEDPAAAGFPPLAKTLVANLDSIEGVPDKIEGISVIDNDTIAIVNDNDFGVGTFDENGQLQSTGTPSRILIIDLSAPILP